MAVDVQAALREKARELLASGQVQMVLGYEKSYRGGSVRPVVVRSAEESERLVWNDRCGQNLCGYLLREPVLGVIRSGGKVAVVAKGCDVRSFLGLVQEKQLKRESVYLISPVCEGVLLEEAGEAKTPAKCFGCEWQAPEKSDLLLGDKSAVKKAQGNAREELEKLERMTPQERWEYWTSLFSKCIKCYACRQACPLCYCKECITEKSRPQWVDKSSGTMGNLAYHMIRAMHLAGRCVGCGECRRACPVGIPVDLLPRYLTAKVEGAFGYRPGIKPEEEPFFVTFKEGDPEDFIR